jgi:hypothetical protein
MKKLQLKLTLFIAVILLFSMTMSGCGGDLASLFGGTSSDAVAGSNSGMASAGGMGGMGGMGM